MAEARKLLERATAYKEEAKREHEKVGMRQFGVNITLWLQMKEKWRRETLEEAEKTEPLEQVKRRQSVDPSWVRSDPLNQLNLSKVCSALREEFESQSQKRFEALNKKFIPLVVTDEPSRKVC